MNSSRSRAMTTWFLLMVVCLTMVVAQQPTTYLDIGGVFPLLTTGGAVDPAGVMRQAGKITTFV